MIFHHHENYTSSASYMALATTTKRTRTQTNKNSTCSHSHTSASIQNNMVITVHMCITDTKTCQSPKPDLPSKLTACEDKVDFTATITLLQPANIGIRRQLYVYQYIVTPQDNI